MSGSTALKRPPHIPHWVQIRSFLSGRDPIGNVRRSLTCPRPPRPPLGPHLALPNRVLVGGPCKALIPHALTGSPVGAILLCDMRPSAALCVHFPTRLASFWWGPFSRRLAEPIFSQNPNHFIGFSVVCCAQL